MNHFGPQYGITPSSAFYSQDMNTSFDLGNAAPRPGPRPFGFEVSPMDFQSTPPPYRSDGGFSVSSNPHYYARPEQQHPLPSGVSENANMSADYQNQYAFRIPPEASNWMSMNSSANSFHSDVYNHPSQPNPTPQSVYTGPPVRYQRNTGFPNRGRPKPSGHFKGNKEATRNRQNPPAAPKEATVFYCEVCKVSCASSRAFKDHEDGQRHKKRMSQAEAFEELKKKVSTDDNSSLVVTSENQLRCELCDVACTGVDSYKSHISGKQHQRTMKLHKDLGKPVPETDNPLVPAAVADKLASATEEAKTSETSENEAPDTTTPNNKLMKHVDIKQLMGPENPPIGQEYIETIVSENGKSVSYRCKLCECEIPSIDTRDCHLRGRRHRTQYKKKVDPSFVVDPNSGNQLLRKSSNGKDKRNKHSDSKSNTSSFPSSNTLRNSGNMGVGSAALLAYDRIPGRMYGPQTPNKSLENRYIYAKHASLVPTPLETQAMMMAVNICKQAMKDVSDDLLKQVRLASDSSGGTVNDSKNGEVKVDEGEEKVGERLLTGILHAGSLGKNLLLRGEHLVHLVLMCSKWPTEELTTYVSTEITNIMKSLESRLEYTITPEPSSGKIMVVVSCPDPSALNENDLPADVISPKKESSPSVWPVITLIVSLSSPVVLDEKTVATTDISEVPIIKRLVTNGNRLPKKVCIESLEAVHQAKWFMNASSRGPLLVVSRILRDFLQSNDYWIDLNEFDVEAHLDRLLCLEYDFLARVSAAPSPPNQPPRTFVPPYLINDLFQPCKLLRKFFESLACGYMYMAVEQHKQQQQLSSGATNNTAQLPLDDRIPLACTKPFYLTINNGVSKEFCEKITISAQLIVRQIAFRQIYKVLDMEPFPSTYNNNNYNNTDESQSDLKYNNSSSVDDVSEDQDADGDGGSDGAGVKRRQPPPTGDNINSDCGGAGGEANADGDENGGDADDGGVQEDPIRAEKMEPLYNSPKRNRRSDRLKPTQ
ncbi:unnamed protein product [Trichobilharzia szidati]|nr:unnamed protein product [Trichobilharzia szidati]